MKNKPPRTPSTQETSSSLDRVVGVNRLFERDVLMDAPRREPRVRASIIGDKKLTANDTVKSASAVPKNATKSSGMRGAEPKSVEGSRTLSRKDTSAKIESRNRATFDESVTVRAEPQFRRERGYNNVLPQGSSSAVDEVRVKVTKKIVYRALGLLLLLGSFASVAYFATEPLTRLLERPLKSVAVEGQFQFLPKDRAMELINNEIDGDFLQLNLDRLKNVLESDPWVDRVSLNRRWPDTLVVKISEQKPIARWDTNGFLNQRGEIIRVNETDKLLGLPWLQGNEKNAREMMQQYQDLATLLRTRGLEIIALKCDNKKSWRLTLKNDVEIAIGRDQVMEKLRRFVTVYDNFLSNVWSDVKTIDVRYTNGVSVRWLPDSEAAKKYLKPEIALQKTVQ